MAENGFDYKPKLRLESPAKSTVTNTKHRFPFFAGNTKHSTFDLYAQAKGGGSGLGLGLGSGLSVADHTFSQGGLRGGTP